MVLTKCKDCGYPISKSADFCPKCGRKIKRTSLFTKVFIFFLCLFIYMFVTCKQSVDKILTQRAEEEDAQKAVEEKRLADLTPEQRVEEEKKRLEQERMQLGLKWNYQEKDDQMGSGKIKSAFVNSLSEFEFDFPYHGLQRATLTLRSHPEWGKDVILSIERGQFLCHVDDLLQFGLGKVNHRFLEHRNQQIIARQFFSWTITTALSLI